MKRIDALNLTGHLVKTAYYNNRARQVGKTTLVKQLAEILKQQEEYYYFLTFEDPTILEAVNKHPKNIFNYTQLPSEVPGDKKLYLIIDEVQYANDPSNLLKLLYDKYEPKVKVIASNS